MNHKITVSLIILFIVSAANAAGKPKTIVTGEKMEMLKSGKVVVFSDGATVKHGPDTLKADRITQDKEANTIEAVGRVEVITSSVSAYSHRALYMQNKEEVVLSGQEQPYLVYTNNGRHDKIRADLITIMMDRRKMILQGNVHGIIEKIED